MNNKHFAHIIIIVASITLFFGCTDNPIPYDLSDSDLNIDTLTVHGIYGGTYRSSPLMGSTTGLYFGNQDGNDNLYSLIQFSNLSIASSIFTYNLLDSTVVMDSLVFNFTALDTNLIMDNPSFAGSRFELSYFPNGGDSVFSESESNYLNLPEANIANSIAIGTGSLILAEPDSNEIVFPTLTISIEDFDRVLNFIADTSDAENRTFMLKNLDPIDGIVALRSRESLDYPTLTAYYQVDEDTMQSIFYPLQDVTIVAPRDVTEDDKNNITISRAAGFKSILQFDITDLPQDSTTMVVKSAELIIKTTSEESLDEIVIQAVVLDETVVLEDFWEILKDEYAIEDDIQMNGSFDFNQMEIELRAYLQGIITGSYDNLGLKLYTSSSSDPFETIRFILDSDDQTMNPYLRITYVKL
jgi:hypothetical protein